MITSMNTTNPEEVAVLCEYTHAVVWAEMFTKDATERAARNPNDPHLETLDNLTELYLNTADRYIGMIATEIMAEITLDAMLGNITPSESLKLRKAYGMFSTYFDANPMTPAYS